MSGFQCSCLKVVRSLQYKITKSCTHSNFTRPVPIINAYLCVTFHVSEKKANVINQHLHLWQTPLFVILFIAEIAWNTASIMMLSMLPEAVKLAGFSDSDSALMVLCMGAANFVGRAASVPLSLLHLNDPLMTYTVSTAMSAVPFLFFPLAESVLEFAIVASAYGLAFGLQIACITPSVIEVVPIRYLVLSYGWLMLADGIGNLSGGPIAGEHV